MKSIVFWGEKSRKLLEMPLYYNSEYYILKLYMEKLERKKKQYPIHLLLSSSLVALVERVFSFRKLEFGATVAFSFLFGN